MNDRTREPTVVAPASIARALAREPLNGEQIRQIAKGMREHLRPIQEGKGSAGLNTANVDDDVIALRCPTGETPWMNAFW